MCITYVEHVYYTYVLDLYSYACGACVGYTHVLYM